MKWSLYVEQHAVSSAFTTSSSWLILSPIEASIRRKIEDVGKPLKDWDITIKRGILTGCNDAFIISTAKRNEILANCQSEEERQRTADLIRPILRGKDIKRYGYNWAGLWLINTHNGVKGKIPPIDIALYPAIKAHLDSYWDKIARRSDQGVTPYNLRDCTYVEDFDKPKIVWKRIGSIIRFCHNENGAFGLDSTCFAAGNDIEYICCVLNSPMGHYLLKDSPRTGTGDLLISVQAIEPLKIPRISKDQSLWFKSQLVNICHIVKEEQEDEINQKIFDLYDLSSEEREYILTHFHP